MNLDKQLEAALTAISLAEKEILNIYSSDFLDGVRFKDNNSPLTLADTASNDVICCILQEAFPSYCILSEESAWKVSKEAKFCWVVDPLDGTKEFIGKNGQFTVNIGLVQNHRVILGVVSVPVTGDIFYAVKGGGAFKKSNGKTVPIKVTDKIKELTWVGSKSHSSEKEQGLIESKRHLISETVSAGSSLKGTMIAEGSADVYYRFGHTCEWDTCAMQCVVEEAGGIFRQMDGSEMLYNRDNHLNGKGFYAVNRAENIWL